MDPKEKIFMEGLGALTGKKFMECVACIEKANTSKLSDIIKWEKQTGTKLSERRAILEFIGQQVLKDQTSGRTSYVIEDNYINIMGKPQRRRGAETQRDE